MLREGFKHGFSDDQWLAAKDEARQAMIAVARSESLIAYSDLVRKIQSCILEPNGAPLAHMLGKSRRKRTKKAGDCSLSW